MAEVEGFFAAGFRSTKLGFAKKGDSNIGGDPDVDVSFIRSLRAALGADAGILVDIGNGVRWDVDTAISVANRMGDLGIGWYEEPLYPTDDAGYRRLRANTNVRLASGEREFTEAGYRRQMEFVQAIDVYGVDPARVEGKPLAAANCYTFRIDRSAEHFAHQGRFARGQRPFSANRAGYC